MKQDPIPEENAMAQVVFHRMKKPESQERQTLKCVLEISQSLSLLMSTLTQNGFQR